MKRITLSLFALMFYAAYLTAGVKVVTNSTSSCHSEAVNGTTTLYLRPDIFRIDIKDEKNSMGMIFKKSEEKMWVLDYNDKKYYTISKEDFQKVNESMSEVKKQMEEQLKNLPEAQRAQMMEMMQKSSGFPAKEEIKREYIKQKETKIVGPWTGQRYDYLENGKLSEIHYVAENDLLNVTDQDMQIMRDFSDFLGENLSSFSFGSSNSAFNEERPYDGFPILTLVLENGKECAKSEVQSFTEEDIPNAIFQIPTDLRKQENPMKGN